MAADSRRPRGSVLIVVMVTIMFAVVALLAFMDKAMNDLLVDHRDIRARELRREAYSALEVTLGVLEDFRAADGGLHSPAEGWNDPLTFAGYTPAEGRTIDVSFEDESGKISLPRADQQSLSRLFQSWDVSQTDADSLADALMGWMKREHVYSTPISPDYEQSTIPYDPPARSLRSYSELAAIDKVREFFYDADGRPNDYWRRFVAAVSLLDFAKSNINGAKPETLAAIGQYDETQRGTLNDYIKGTGTYQSNGPGFFQDTNQAQALVGIGGNAGAFSTSISALRINITVHDGKTEFRLSAVVTAGNGAKTVQQTASAQKVQDAKTTAANAPNASQASSTTTGTNQRTAAQAQNLKYPYTLLEIRENDEIPSAPSAPATDTPI